MNLYHILLIFKGALNLWRHKKEEAREDEWTREKKKEIEQWKKEN